MLTLQSLLGIPRKILEGYYTAEELSLISTHDYTSDPHIGKCIKSDYSETANVCTCLLKEFNKNTSQMQIRVFNMILIFISLSCLAIVVQIIRSNKSL